MRLSLVGLNLLALSLLLASARLVLEATDTVAPVGDASRLALYAVFGAGAAACLYAALQFSRRRRGYGALGPAFLTVGALLLVAGVGWLVAVAAWSP